MRLTVKEWRRAKDITMESMADALGIHRITYLHKEKEPSTFTMLQAAKICEVLGVDQEDVIFLP